ncbi:MAG: hypothetical protein IT372_35295 [Polyangiaceae bacterium]|nr:hypothetical protein [Polyangiaceae bacterium]
MAARSAGGGRSGAHAPRDGVWGVGRATWSATRSPRCRTGARVVAAAAFAVGLAIAGAARADDAQQLELAKTRFDAGQYEEAAARFAAMLDPALPPCEKGPSDPAGKPCRITDPDLIERARGLAAASLVALQRGAEADVFIEQILLNNPAFVPNPAVFQPEVIDRFIAVRARVREKIEAAAKQKAEAERSARLKQERVREEERRWIAEIRELASRERVIETRSRWIAAIPFGVGQFQNGDEGLGWAFLIGEAALGATSIVSAAVVSGYEGIDVTARAAPESGQTQSSIDIDALNSRIETATLVNRISFGAFAALAVAGVVQAQIAFVPERSTYRQRPSRPPPPSLSAGASVLPGGAAFGVSGRF